MVSYPIVDIAKDSGQVLFVKPSEAICDSLMVSKVIVFHSFNPIKAFVLAS